MPGLRMVLGGSLLLWAGAVLCGAQTGSIDGTVSDSAGAVIPGAAITIRNLQSSASRSVTSNAVGAYSIPDLSVGTYDITVAKTGFKTFQVSGARLSVAQSLTIAASIEPGAVNQEIEVRGDQLPAIDRDTAQVSNLVDGTEIRDLPLITRNPYDLILLSPGTFEINALGGITVNGSRERNNNFLLDGVDNNDTSVPGRIGGVLNANPDSAEEFRVITNNFNAEFGRNTGAIVDVVTAVISYIWQLPLGRGASYLNRGALGRILEGISVSSIPWRSAPRQSDDAIACCRDPSSACNLPPSADACLLQAAI